MDHAGARRPGRGEQRSGSGEACALVPHRNEVELVELIAACAAGLDLALDYDRSQAQGKVTIRSDLGFSDRARPAEEVARGTGQKNP
jgi:hypothetical protein